MFIHHPFYYAPDTGKGGGAADEPDQPETPESNGDGSGGNDDKRTFTQAEVDALIGERAKRAKESGTRAVLEALGIEDVEAAKAALAEAEKLKKEQMSELEKAQADAQKLQDELAKTKAEKEAAEAKARETAMRAAVMQEAAKANFYDGNDAWLFVDRETLELAEDGTVNGAEKAVAAVAKAKPHLVKTAGQTPGSPRANGTGRPAGNKEKAPKPRISF